MREIEQRYGVDNVGPWDDWEWGFAFTENSLPCDGRSEVTGIFSTPEPWEPTPRGASSYGS
jgi:hypothetical protein